MNNQPVDCGLVDGRDPRLRQASADPAENQPNLAPLFLGLTIMGLSLVLFYNYGGLTYRIKMELIDFANEKARRQRTNPDMSFLFYFDTRYPGAAELEIAERAYQEMVAWNSRTPPNIDSYLQDL